MTLLKYSYTLYLYDPLIVDVHEDSSDPYIRQKVCETTTFLKWIPFYISHFIINLKKNQDSHQFVLNIFVSGGYTDIM